MLHMKVRCVYPPYSAKLNLTHDRCVRLTGLVAVEDTLFEPILKGCHNADDQPMPGRSCNKQAIIVPQGPGLRNLYHMSSV